MIQDIDEWMDLNIQKKERNKSYNEVHFPNVVNKEDNDEEDNDEEE